MSTPTSNTAVMTETTSSGLSIGLIVGVIVIAILIIGVVVYVMKKRRNGANLGAAPPMPSPGGPNAGMPSPTATNVNSNNLSRGNGRPQ
jgi:hypothetical protein